MAGARHTLLACPHDHAGIQKRTAGESRWLRNGTWPISGLGGGVRSRWAMTQSAASAVRVEQEMDDACAKRASRRSGLVEIRQATKGTEGTEKPAISFLCFCAFCAIPLPGGGLIACRSADHQRGSGEQILDT